MVVVQKQKEWQEALARVAQITDRIGMSVDKEITETVAILYLFGFMTTASCGGHLDRVNEGPFVMLRSSKASELEKQLACIPDHNGQEYIKLKNEIAGYTIAEQNKLFDLLKRFYASRKPILGRMLTLRTIGYSDFRLNCQGSELAYVESMQEKKTRLALNRTEMETFTEWLKKLYFGSDISGLESKSLFAGNLFIEGPTKKTAVVLSEMAETIQQVANVCVDFVYDGCFDGANGGPYVLFVSPRAEEVRKSMVAKRDSLTNTERNVLYREAMKYNVADQQRLYRLLNDFYAQRNLNYERMLTIQTVRFSNFRLRYQAADVALVEIPEDRLRNLEANYDEMRAFTGYLRVSFSDLIRNLIDR